MPRRPPHRGPLKAAEFLPAARSRRHRIEQTPAPIGLQRQTHIGASPRGYGVAQSQAVPDGAGSALPNYPRQGVEVLTRPLPMSHICMEPLVMQRVEGGRSECEPASNGSSTNSSGMKGAFQAGMLVCTDDSLVAAGAGRCTTSSVWGALHPATTNARSRAAEPAKRFKSVAPRRRRRCCPRCLRYSDVRGGPVGSKPRAERRILYGSRSCATQRYHS